jgi:multicomponent K+:H+ antiporter subunit A
MLAVAIALGLQYRRVAAGEVLRDKVAWLPSLGVDLVLRVDGFAWMFAMLVSGSARWSSLCALLPLARDPARASTAAARVHGRDARAWCSRATCCSWCVLGTHQPVLLPADRVLARPQGRAARRAHRLRGHASGGLALLAGVVLLGHVVGSYELDAVLAAGDRLRSHPLYLAILVLVLRAR